MLAGDALHTLAFDILLGHTDDPTLACALGRELATASGFAGMVGGQVDDLAGGGAAPDLARLQAIHHRKTAALIRGCARGGALAGGASAEQVEALGSYGEALGMAFQITDDVLDVTGTAETLGKTPGKDEREQKLTYVAFEGVDAARARAASEVERALAALESVPDPVVLAGLAHLVANRDR